MPPTTDQSEPEPTHRLNRIIVQEVSLVDRAANKRRFLVIKRDEPMKKPVKKEDAAAATANVADSTAAAGDSTSGGTATDAGTGAAGGTSMQQQVKEGLTAGLADIAEKIVAIANQVDAVEVTDQPVDPAVPADVTKQISDAAKALTDLAAKFGGVADAGASTSGDESTAGAAVAQGEGGGTPAGTAKAKEEDKTPPTDAEKAAVTDAEEETAKKGLDVAKHRDLVTKSVAKRLGVDLEAANIVVAKVGRRMAKKRLEQFAKAVDMLIGLMKELRQDVKAPPPAVGKNEKTEKSAIVPVAADVAALLKNAESLLEVSKAQSGELTIARAELAKANAKLAKLEKATGASNVIALEKSGGNVPGGPVPWPWDMNQRGARAAK